MVIISDITLRRRWAHKARGRVYWVLGTRLVNSKKDFAQKIIPTRYIQATFRGRTGETVVLTPTVGKSGGQGEHELTRFNDESETRQ